ncbi:MAG TPA: glycoside hydrolase family 5 protein, partial [Polyangiaceae bacterium]|nr:glycoside hydrolase family 5 protein [Polyangiaceae bacterium]
MGYGHRTDVGRSLALSMVALLGAATALSCFESRGTGALRATSTTNLGSSGGSGLGSEVTSAGGDQALGGTTGIGNPTPSGGTGTGNDVTSLGGTHNETNAVTALVAKGGATAQTNSGTDASALWLTSTLPLRGVNLAGAEFGETHLPGIHGTDYVYPDPAYAIGYDSLPYYLSKGLTAFRLPFRWERLQPTLLHAFNPEELARLHATVKRITDAGAFVVLDPHNYARYQGKLVGSDVTNEAFADLWSRLTAEFLPNERVVFGLMNEPHTMPTEQWLSSANVAIKAIRDAGATQLVLVPGNNWAAGYSWTSDLYGTPNSSVMNGVVDPRNNYAFELHQYFDSDGSGTQDACVSATQGSEALRGATEWLRRLGKRAFLGEFGASAQPLCLSAVDDLLNYLEHNTDVWLGWTWWAGGPWWDA